MGIQYSGGTPVNYVFNSDATRRKLVDELAAQLALAGWSYVSGEGTADVVMQSDNSAQNIFTRARLYDPGSGNCAQFFIRNNGVPSLLQGAAGYMLPTNGKQFRIWANKHWAGMWSVGPTYRTTAREILFFGTVSAPDHVVTHMGGDLQCGWMVYTGDSDTQINTGSSFRATHAAHSSVGTLRGASLYKGAVVNYTNAGGDSNRGPMLSMLTPTTSQTGGHRWVSGRRKMVAPIIGWGAVANSGEVEDRGYLTDAMVIGGQFTGETETFSYDGKTWMPITDMATGAAGLPQATLFVVVP